jgi:uncharacterized damage-inducible protein DinB
MLKQMLKEREKMEVFVQQYEWIKQTREMLFNYCETMSPADYTRELESFGGDSIRNLHAHVADCYRVWLGVRALGKSMPEINPEMINSVEEMRNTFKQTDELVHEFLNEFEGRWDEGHVASKNGKMFTALWLFTHTTTHEFHHKGQIVKIGRILGYIPPDTDLIEP